MGVCVCLCVCVCVCVCLLSCLFINCFIRSFLPVCIQYGLPMNLLLVHIGGYMIVEKENWDYNIRERELEINLS